MVFCACSVCVTLTLAAILWASSGPVARAQIANLARSGLVELAKQLVRAFSRKPALLAIIVSGVMLAGCEQLNPSRAYPLPAPPPEQPICDLPASMHVRNWLGPLGQGSCVHASLKNHALWHNDFAFATQWPWSDGEYASRLMERLEDAGKDYGFTEKSDPRFLDWCHETRHGCILWWKPSHCCTFMGWVSKDGVQHAAVLDNNYPGKFEYVERQQFVRLWSGYGGFALCLLEPPTIAMPYKSYEVQ